MKVLKKKLGWRKCETGIFYTIPVHKYSMSVTNFAFEKYGIKPWRQKLGTE